MSITHQPQSCPIHSKSSETEMLSEDQANELAGNQDETGEDDLDDEEDDEDDWDDDDDWEDDEGDWDDDEEEE